MQNNGTIWGITIICPSSTGETALYKLVQDPLCLSYQKRTPFSLHSSHLSELNEYQLRSIAEGGRNLIWDKPTNIARKSEIISVLNHKVGIYLVDDFNLYTDFRTADPLLKSYCTPL